MILDDIIDHKRREVSDAKARSSIAQLRDRVSPGKPGRFQNAISRPGRLCLIAEVKKASPSRGVICENFDPSAIAATYANNGASAISVLTDRKYFQGDPSHLKEAREASGLPTLRKDFIIDEYQVWETASIGADAVLLIVAALSENQLKEYLALASEIGLDALVEVHDQEQLTVALDAGSNIIGINNRDLRTFETDIDTTVKLAGKISDERVLVSESGIHTRADAQRVKAAGANAILVGEALMKSGDVGAKIRELIDVNG